MQFGILLSISTVLALLVGVFTLGGAWLLLVKALALLSLALLLGALSVSCRVARQAAAEPVRPTPRRKG
ncbi:MAG: hypothetical protein D6746_16440 [Bacteroidetes bacterium]|nr:MAG: hypothetical protein D6746_16440 [Bacteroidota bacterium]GIV57245.1 MAG: hypothetical protein KatS3mg042_0158 [Rhodothermaceae bacterium]